MVAGTYFDRHSMCVITAFLQDVPCRGNRKLCQQQLQQLQQKKKRPRKDKKNKKDKRCCKKLNKICKRKFRKLCKVHTKCLIRESRNCRKKFSRCSKKKEANRRPGNCGSTKTTSINQDRNEYNKPYVSTTTTTPVFVKKSKLLRCLILGSEFTAFVKIFKSILLNRLTATVSTLLDLFRRAYSGSE